MNPATHNKIVSFIWGIANVLRDLFKRGKYPDVILPMCVLRRLDAVLEPTKDAVLAKKKELDEAGIRVPDAILRDVAGQAFYNTSHFTMRDLLASGKKQQLLANFKNYLDGFSPNVQEILENFKFRNQLSTLSDSNVLGTLIEKFLDPKIDLSPSGIDNHSMGMIFEELVRKFNEDNNEEAGEHWTPRDAVRLMSELVFRPIESKLKSGTYTLYDCACGTGGMLTVAEETLVDIAKQRKLRIKYHLHGQEINPETFAVCKADMLLKGEGANADNIIGGAAHSTLSHDAFPDKKFDFMLSNPPYGKDWKKDLDELGGKNNIRDSRFGVNHRGEDMSLITRVSDGQMLFLANMASKMQTKSELGSRIAEVHNGSSLFTGDAGQGESNIRRWIIENDWLEAIIALPENLFYNTGIATYIWVLSNRKLKSRQGKVQLINAVEWSRPLRKNLGKKNCELSSENIKKITQTFLEFKQTPQSKIFPNAAFGYWKIIVERPLRLRAQLSQAAIDSLRFTSGDRALREQLHNSFGDDLFTNFDKIVDKVAAYLDEQNTNDENDGLDERTKKNILTPQTWTRDAKLSDTAKQLRDELGEEVFADYNEFRMKINTVLSSLKGKISSSERDKILAATHWRDENAPPVERITHTRKKLNPLYGLFPIQKLGKTFAVEYESDSELRDTEQIPMLEKGGVEAFFRREVLPFAPDSWIRKGAAKIGYEVSFTRHFYRPKKLRPLEEIRTDIDVIQQKKTILQKQKETIIHRAVTRGLDDSVALKPSGIPWLSDIPTHWKVIAVKQQYSIQLGKMLQNTPMKPNDIEVPYLKAQHVQWFFVQTENAHKMWANPTDVVQFGIRVGDLLVCEGGEGGRCGIVKKVEKDYIIQNALHRVRPKGNNRNDYLLYVMNAISATGWFDAINSKATIAHFTNEKFGALKIPLPPPAEQAMIVDYLDQMTSSIQSTITLVRREINLLHEYRSRLIADVVTGKLDDSVALKPSGIPWFGDIPTHWEVKRAKWLFRYRKESNVAGIEKNVLSLTLRGVVNNDPNNPEGLVPRDYATYQIFDKDDLVFKLIDLENLQTSRVGLVHEKGIMSPAYIRLVPNVPLYADFFYYQFYDLYNRGIYNQLGAGVRSTLNSSDLLNLRVCIPPQDEQIAIIAHIKKIIGKIDSTINLARREINLLHEYRSRLIADVVTGKLDVRDVVAQLPAPPK